MLGLEFTGANAEKSLINVRSKTLDGEYKATRMNIVLDAQQTIEVSDTGITFFYQTNIKLLIK